MKERIEILRKFNVLLERELPVLLPALSSAGPVTGHAVIPEDSDQLLMAAMRREYSLDEHEDPTRKRDPRHPYASARHAKVESFIPDGHCFIVQESLPAILVEMDSIYDEWEDIKKFKEILLKSTPEDGSEEHSLITSITRSLSGYFIAKGIEYSPETLIEFFALVESDLAVQFGTLVEGNVATKGRTAAAETTTTASSPVKFRSTPDLLKREALSRYQAVATPTAAGDPASPIATAGVTSTPIDETAIIERAVQAFIGELVKDLLDNRHTLRHGPTDPATKAHTGPVSFKEAADNVYILADKLLKIFHGNNEPLSEAIAAGRAAAENKRKKAAKRSPILSSGSFRSVATTDDGRDALATSVDDLDGSFALLRGGSLADIHGSKKVSPPDIDAGSPTTGISRIRSMAELAAALLSPGSRSTAGEADALPKPVPSKLTHEEQLRLRMEAETRAATKAPSF